MRRIRSGREAQYNSATYADLKQRIGSAVRALRASRGLTQEEAAARCDMAVQLIQRIEAGKTNLTLTTIARVCEGLGVDARELLGDGDGGQSG